MAERIDTVDWGNAKPGSTLTVAGDYREIVDAMRRRKSALNLSSAEIAARCGLGESYVRKLLTGSKVLGPLSTGLLLAVLGLKIAIVVETTPQPGLPKNNLEAA